MDLIYYAVDQSRHDPAIADGVVCVASSVSRMDVPVIGKMAYFYQPVSVPLFPHWDGRGLKGHDVLVRAVPLVLEFGPDAKFVLVGRGSGPDGEAYERGIRELVTTLGVSDSVIFTGERRDAPDTLAMFDVSVHCSLTDNLAGTVESLLMARPMVVSEIPGFADTCVTNKLVSSFRPDDPEALAVAIVRLLRTRSSPVVLARAAASSCWSGSVSRAPLPTSSSYSRAPRCRPVATTG